MTVTLVEVEKTDTKKEGQKVDHALTQRCGGRSGASGTPRMTAASKVPCPWAIGQGRDAVCAPERTEIPHTNVKS